jgi:hypothetical protein
MRETRGNRSRVIRSEAEGLADLQRDLSLRGTETNVFEEEGDDQT